MLVTERLGHRKRAEAPVAARRRRLGPALLHHVVAQAAAIARQHDGPAALLRVAHRQRHGRASAHRVRHDAYVFDAEVVQQRHRVLAEGAPAAVVAVDALPKGAVVKGDAGVVLGEERYLLPPAQVVAALPVRKQHGRPGAVDFVVEVYAVDRCKGHRVELYRHVRVCALSIA